jgi:hypothetical protein
MIWLASYPRSGNTFFRIVLHEVYGVESGAFRLDAAPDAGYLRYQVVKTHLPPGELKPADPSIPAVYIVRDGRDALVSMARQRSEIIAPGSDYMTNLETAIRARDDTFFGGWSRNVTEWLERADVVVRFEDLIRDPIGEVERIRPLINLPAPERSRLPSFDDLKKRDYPLNEKQRARNGKVPSRREKFFRRGEPGAWRDEMPIKMQALFRRLHGETLSELGYDDDTWQARLAAPWFAAVDRARAVVKRAMNRRP